MAPFTWLWECSILPIPWSWGLLGRVDSFRDSVFSGCFMLCLSASRLRQIVLQVRNSSSAEKGSGVERKFGQSFLCAAAGLLLWGSGVFMVGEIRVIKKTSESRAAPVWREARCLCLAGKGNCARIRKYYPTKKMQRGLSYIRQATACVSDIFRPSGVYRDDVFLSAGTCVHRFERQNPSAAN